MWELWEKPEAQYSKDEKEMDKLCSAWAKCALALRTKMRYGHNGDSIRCFSFVEIYEQLEVLRRRFEAGNAFALLQAVQQCADENVPMPTWLANAFANALKSYQTIGGPDSLDVVFKSTSSAAPKQRKTDKPTKVELRRLDWQLGAWLWTCAWQLAVSNESITSMKQLVLLVLDSGPPANSPWRQWSVAKTKAGELILMIDKNQGELLNWPASKSLPQFLAKRRKR